jgi:hypothetical protein
MLRRSRGKISSRARREYKSTLSLLIFDNGFNQLKHHSAEVSDVPTTFD